MHTTNTLRGLTLDAEGLEENIKVRKLGVLTEAEQRLCSYENRETRASKDARLDIIEKKAA